MAVRSIMNHHRNILRLQLLVFTLATFGVAIRAADTDPLQDFCIADLSPGAVVYANGYPCRDPKNATVEDFIYKGLKDAAIITPDNPWNAKPTLAFARHWPALNTLGLGLARIDVNPGGVVAPHTHNLATEIVMVTSGELIMGFIANSDNVHGPNKLFTGLVKTGEAFLIPRGLVHFQLNKGHKPASTLNIFNSQNPGVSFLPLTLFGAQPPIDPEVIAKAFALNATDVVALECLWSRLTNAFV